MLRIRGYRGRAEGKDIHHVKGFCQGGENQNGESDAGDISERLAQKERKMERLEKRGADHEDTGQTPDMISSGKIPDGWFPVSERTPKIYGDYLVTIITNDYRDGEPYTNWMCWDNEGMRWTDTVGAPTRDDIIAWMPLPEPYSPIKKGEPARISPAGMSMKKI